MLLTSLDGLPQLDNSFFDSRLLISDDLITFIGFLLITDEKIEEVIISKCEQI